MRSRKFFTRLFVLLSFLAIERGNLFAQHKPVAKHKKHAVNKKKKGKKRNTARRSRYQYPLQDSSLWSSRICFESTDQNVLDSIVSLGKSFVGLPYRYSGADPRGFDCSGFVMYCFKRFGIPLSHHAGVQMKQGAMINKQEARPGDLIFFGYRGKRGPYISHSGIVFKNEGGKIYFIHSASRQGIRVDCLDQAWYRQRFMGLRRVVAITATS